jgi:hypothetical protein
VLFFVLCGFARVSGGLVQERSVLIVGTALSFLPEWVAQFLNINYPSSGIKVVDLALAGQRTDAGTDLYGVFAKIFNIVFHYVMITNFTRMSLVGGAFPVFDNVGALARFSSISFEDRNDLVIEFQVDNGCTTDLLIQPDDF